MMRRRSSRRGLAELKGWPHRAAARVAGPEFHKGHYAAAAAEQEDTE